ncbi:MAG: HIT domain-containing protein [Lachnospiraceae bacterium]|jgi:histidine triad (HIT) family protein|nr:HIT domain-containing protein [Lachnospiraceae bacterium]
MEDCIFCKLANGVIPTRTLYEDEMVRVILDAAPATKGHALILLKDHREDFYALSDEQATHVMKVAKVLALHLKNVLACDGLNVLQNNGEAAGQTIFHYHMHLVPRYNEKPPAIDLHSGQASDAQLQEIYEQLTTQEMEMV